MSMTSVRERVFPSPSPTTALVLDADERLLGAEERELLLLVLQEAPIEADSSDGSGDTDETGAGDDGDRKHEQSAASGDRGRGGGESTESTDNESASGVAHPAKGSVVVQTQKKTEQQEKVVKVNPRRNRKRRKHEVDALRIEEKELLEKLQQLQLQQQVVLTQGDGNLVATSVDFQEEQADASQSGQQSQWIVITKENAVSPSSSSSAATTSIWESLAWFQREEARTAMKENQRLKTLYQQQLQMLQRLEATYNIPQSALHGELSYWQQDFSDAALVKRTRTDPFDADFAIFASLGHDFEAQYLKTDSILSSAGLTNFDGRMRQDMMPRRGENGIYFLESVFSKIIPIDMHEHDERIWTVFANEQLHSHHDSYEVRGRTNNTIFRKIVDTIRLPQAETTSTLIRRTAIKRYVEAERIVVVWDTVLEIVGSVSMRLRERGWKQLRRPHTIPEHHTSGPLSVDQGCFRVTPELRTTYLEQDIAAGSLANTIVSSYLRRLRTLHHQSRGMFIAMFGNMSIHGSCHKNCPRAAADSAPPAPPALRSYSVAL